MYRRNDIGLIYSNNREKVLYALSGLVVIISFFVCFRIWEDSARLFSFLDLPLFVSILGLIVLSLAGNVFLICLFWLDGRYVLRIERIDRKHVLITTWRLFRRPKTVKYYDGILKTVFRGRRVGRHRSASPFRSPCTLLRTPRGKKLLIDHAGDFLGEAWYP